MDREPDDFRRRLEGMARHDCIPSMNRNYLSDRLAKELRSARDATTAYSSSRPLSALQARKCGTSQLPSSSGVQQILKSNLGAEDRISPGGCAFSIPVAERIPTSPPPRSIGNETKISSYSPSGSRPKTPDMSYKSTRIADRGGMDCDRYSDRILEASRLKGLTDLEDKVEFLNCQAQQLLKQLKREQADRERMSSLYDEALDEVRRLREKERCGERSSYNPEAESRMRRLECERDEALLKVRTSQVDQDEMKSRLEKIAEENAKERQRLTDKMSSLESRLHATEMDRDELSRRHTRVTEQAGKLELQVDEQKTKLAALEEQKQDYLKQIDNLGMFIKDLEQSSKQMHDKLDEKRFEVYQCRDRAKELEDLVTKLEQHLQQEKERSVQLQNDAYQSQIRCQELRNEVRNVLKKKPKPPSEC